MKKISLIFLMVIAFMLSPINAQAKINIFACEPEWQSLSKEIGGDYVKAFSATNALQDPHYIRAKPSLIAKIRKADLLICSGAELESGWLPILLQKGKKNIQSGQIGHLMAADFVDTIEKPTSLDRSMGDLHAQGNPHLHLDPYNILLIAAELKNRLQKIDHENAAYYTKQYDNFVSKWRRKISEWEKKSAKLKGLKLVTHHKSFNYLIKWLDMNEIATLEAKPGIAPNISHLESLLILLKETPAKFIIRTPFDPNNASNWLGKKTGIKQLILPFTIGGNKQSKDLFTLFDSMINLLLDDEYSKS